MKVLVSHIFILLSFLGFSQATIKVGVSKMVVQEGEKFQYEVIMNQNCNLELPKFDGVEVIAGPMIGQSSSYSNYYGNSSSSTTYSYSYTLQALKKGKYTIGSPKMTCGKEVTYGDEISIEVVDSDQINDRNPEAIQNYIELNSSKEEVYEGEPFVLNTTFYSIEQPSSIEVITQGKAEDLKREEITLNRVVSPGDKYFQVDLSQEVAYATKPGNVEIMPYTAVLQKEIDFFNVKRLEGISNKLEIKVLPLPGGAPEYFTGLVGDIELMYDISKTNVNVGEAIDLDIRIKGIGNFEQMSEPVLKLPDAFFVHDPEIFKNTKATPKGIEGEIRYKFAIVPEVAGEFEVQPFVLAFFNFKTEKYEVVGTDKMTITVGSGSEDYGKVYKNRVEKSTPELTSLSGLSDEHETRNGENEFFGSFLHIGGTVTPLFLVGAFLLIARSRANMSEEALMKGQKKSAAAIAIKKLNQIDFQQAKAPQEIKNVLEEFLMVKLSVSRAEMSKSTIEKHLIDKNIAQETQLNFGAVWQKLEMSAYAPMAQSDVSTLAVETQELISNLNKSI